MLDKELTRGSRHSPAASNGARTLDQIEAELAATRERLAGTIDALAGRVHPKVLGRRGFEGAKASVLDEQGHPRTGRIVMAAIGACGGTLLAVLALRKLSRRRTRGPRGNA